MEQSPWPKALKVTASTGVTQLKEHESIRAAIKRADKALYRFKDNGRNQVAAVLLRPARLTAATHSTLATTQLIPCRYRLSTYTR